MALLAATKKTGELRVVGEQVDGRVHLDAGRVVAAQVGRADSFVDAVFELLRLTSGKFSFDADRTPESAGEPADIEPLLFEAGARLAEWREIEVVVPSMAHAIDLVVELDDPHVTLAADQWRMVVAVASASCVADVAEHLGLGEYGTCKALKGLVESGVVAVSDPPADAPARPKATAAPAPAAPVVEPEPEPVAGADPEPEAATQPEPTAASEPEPAPAPAKVDGGKVVIEPERKPDAKVGGVDIPVLTAKDHTAPIPPGEEPVAKGRKTEAAAGDKVPVSTGPVSKSQAKQLVSQLAAMGGDKQDAPAAKTAEKAEDDKGAKNDEEAEEIPAAATAAPSAAEGGDTEEPLNRGLLLKFLSSVRQ